MSITKIKEMPSYNYMKRTVNLIKVLKEMLSTIITPTK
jgi:hypothetical protein